MYKKKMLLNIIGKFLFRQTIGALGHKSFLMFIYTLKITFLVQAWINFMHGYDSL